MARQSPPWNATTDWQIPARNQWRLKNAKIVYQHQNN